MSPILTQHGIRIPSQSNKAEKDIKRIQIEKEEVELSLFADGMILYLRDPEPGMVAHTCNPTYSGGRDQEDFSSLPVQQKVHKTPAQSIKNWVWWGAHVIQATQEAQVGESRSAPVWVQAQDPISKVNKA
jgi:hypothetical protein